MNIGVLLMSYGTPASTDAIVPFYTDIRRGHPPTDAQVDDLRRRYEAIGGISPLTERSLAQVHALQTALDATNDRQFTVYYGTKHATPSIDDAVAKAAADGIRHMVGLVLAPHYSKMSIGDYITRATAAGEQHGVALTFIADWHDLPALVALLSERVLNARGSLNNQTTVEVVFTAHSLPARIAETDDPYVAQLAASARLIANSAGITNYRLSWQSAGRTGEPWLGPDISETITAIAAEGASGIVVCPQGFTSDHLEVLYDLDVVAAQHARTLGMQFVRTPSLNDDPQLASGLAALVVAQCARTWPTV